MLPIGRKSSGRIGRTFGGPATMKSAGSTNAGRSQGRNAPSVPTGSSATSSGKSLTDTLAASADKTYNLDDSGDFIGFTLALTVTATGNTATVDILQALAAIKIYGPSEGAIVTFIPINDIYMYSQRFSQLGLLPATVNDSGATAVSGNYYIPLSLPAAKGPYQVEMVAASNAGFSASTTALSVLFSLKGKVGAAVGGYRSRYVSTPSSTQPTVSGQLDFAPIATVQDVSLVELFLQDTTGSANIGNEIASLQVVSDGKVIVQNSSGAQIAQEANQKLVTAAPVGVLYPLLALDTSIKLGRSSTFLAQFSATANTSGWRIGYAWVD